MGLTPKQVGAYAGGGLVISALGYALYRAMFPTPINNVYSYIRDNQPNGMVLRTFYNAPNWLGTAGGMTINNQVLEALNHDNVLAFSNRFHNILVNHNLWTWDPANSAGNNGDGSALLDGLRTQGECAIPAHALQVLLTFPTPYGFQRSEDNFACPEYTGQYHQGFIATHAHTVMGLQANTWRSNRTRVNFYNWMNHKTLRYNGRFYDPSYGTSQGGPGYYDTEADMAVAQIRGSINFDAGVFINKHVFGILKTDDTDNEHRGFYVACARNPVNGDLPTTGQYDANSDAFKVAYVGPFNTDVSDSAHDFGFDNTNDYLAGINNLPN